VIRPAWKPSTIALGALPIALLGLLVASLGDLALTRRLFVDTTYYFLMATVLCWAGTYFQASRGFDRHSVIAWVQQNWPGLVIAIALVAIVAVTVEPALRVLSDEANLVGTSKNLFTSKAPTFTVSGKNYYGSYWDVDVAIDRRPALFPFFVSLVHTVCGYAYTNAFWFNLLVLAAFIVVAYQLAQSMAGERLGVVAAVFVASHPITLITARSAAFDLLASFFALLTLKSLLDHIRHPSPAKAAILWMNLCLFANIRYESALFVPPLLLLLFAFKLVSWKLLRPFAFVYALTPAYFLPRIWLDRLRGSVPEQDPGAVTFSAEHFVNHAYEYFQPLFSPFRSYPAHSAILIALGVIGCLLWLRWLARALRAGNWAEPRLKFAVCVTVWMLLQAIIVFSYVWGRAQYPSAARLVLSIDTFFSFAAAWVVTRALERWRAFIPVLLAVAVFVFELPEASQARMMNRLTQTRESAATWRFFERLDDKRILIVTDRPNHFTIMNYGAMDFASARRDRYLFTAFERRLFQDVYVIQQIELSTNEPLPGYEIWPQRRLEPVLEFQNDANVLVRISRLAR